ncbi:DNA polymerase III subunit delta [Desulfuribacillus alkaliarsenatis]|uniref:DNA polymerase III subunit delta n=1 Tax=Desulfuribacillus alkaliarsenatis TaxID=766136 RepID=UPI0009FD1E01|nr:DNA polymerase III subunit delta [Desulfuribacillus alkaliarsenatis]
MSNIYLLHGSEEVLMNEWVSRVITKYLPDGKEDLNYSVFDLDETPIQNVIQQAETIPFIGEKRVIVAGSADFFGSGSGKQSHDLEGLLKFIDNPPDFSTVILKTNLDKLDKRKKITKQLEKNKAIISFEKLQGKLLEDWVTKKLESMGCSIEQEALNKLVLSTGSNITILSKEIEKLCLYIGQGKITAEHVILLVPRSLEQNLFSFVDKLAKRDIEQGLQIIYDLLKNKESPILILFFITKKFRTMLLAKELADKGYSPQQIASQVGQHPYAVKISLEQARAFSYTQIRKIIISLAQADEQIKTGKLTDVLALEKFVLTLSN